MNRLLLAALLAAAPASAAGLASRPAEEWTGDTSNNLEGLYAAIGGGASLLIVPGDNTFGYDGEIRLGYSFNPMLQLYLSGALDGGSFSGVIVRTEQILAFLQYHLLVKPAVMVYGRAGIGVGLSRDIAPGSTAAGLAEAGGLGVEIRIAPNLFVAPELFYRNTNLSASGADTQIQTVGLQLNLTYY
jgi:opacity protein-like surface antigen